MEKNIKFLYFSKSNKIGLNFLHSKLRNKRTRSLFLGLSLLLCLASLLPLQLWIIRDTGEDTFVASALLGCFSWAHWWTSCGQFLGDSKSGQEDPLVAPERDGVLYSPVAFSPPTHVYPSLCHSAVGVMRLAPAHGIWQRWCSSPPGVTTEPA